MQDDLVLPFELLNTFVKNLTFVVYFNNQYLLKCKRQRGAFFR